MSWPRPSKGWRSEASQALNSLNAAAANIANSADEAAPAAAAESRAGQNKAPLEPAAQSAPACPPADSPAGQIWRFFANIWPLPPPLPAAAPPHFQPSR